jgi:predicted XRE-type DNA-binding protein
MPIHNGDFTKGELAFLDHYAVHQDRVKAEKHAGLAPRVGYAILARPAVQAELQRRLRVELIDLGTLAVAKIKHHLTSDKTPAAVAQKAAEYVLNVARDTGIEGVNKELHELTADELASMILHLDARKAALATPVSTPDPFA